MEFSKIFIFFTLIFLVSATFVSAQDITAPFNSDFDLKRTCFNNETLCSSSAQCNITITYPDGTLLSNNVPMTNQGSFHNITLLHFSLNQMGDHDARFFCTDPGGDIIGNGKETFVMTVTADGKPFNILPIQIIILGIGLILIIVGKTKEDLRIIQIFGSFIVFIIGIITLFPGYAFINFSTLMGKTIGFTSIGFGAYFMIEPSFSRNKQDSSFKQESEEQIEEVEDGRFHDND